MSEPPCPVCHVDGERSTLDGRHRRCSVCGFNVIDVEWRRLARAVALLEPAQAIVDHWEAGGELTDRTMRPLIRELRRALGEASNA